MLAEKIYLEEQQYELKNLLLAYPSDWFLNEKTLEKAKEGLKDLKISMKDFEKTLEKMKPSSQKIQQQ